MENKTTETRTPYGIIYRSRGREWFAGSKEELETAKAWEEAPDEVENGRWTYPAYMMSGGGK